MATEKEIENFKALLKPQTTYLDSGFDKYFDKRLFQRSFDKSAADFNSEVESISFNRISQGVSTSSGGKIKIDYDKGRITISDGSVDRIIIGEL